MKGFYNLSILFSAALLYSINLSAQTETKFTTSKLLDSVKQKGLRFVYTSNDQFIYALPLIDTAVAIRLAILTSVENPIEMSKEHNDYIAATALQCRDSSLKNLLLNILLPADNRCYAYPNLQKNALLYQVQKQDSSLLNIAMKEFDFWAPYAFTYFDTAIKAHIQLFSARRTFSPCVMASAQNISLWASIIYLITGKEEYGSPNEQANEVYRKILKSSRVKRDPEERKDFIRLNKKDDVALPYPLYNFDSVDFETIPALKEMFDKTRKYKNPEIIICNNKNKALLYLYYEDKTPVGAGFFKKVYAGFSSIFFIELNSPTTMVISKISYRERYY